jgi:hypothetical protein
LADWPVPFVLGTLPSSFRPFGSVPEVTSTRAPPPETSLLLQFAMEVTSLLALLGPVLLVLATVVDRVVVAHDVPGMIARPENATAQTIPTFKPLLFLILPPFLSRPGLP